MMKKIIVLSMGVLFIFSCSSEKLPTAEPNGESSSKEEIVNEGKSEDRVSYSKEQINELKTASKVVYTLPSPVEMAHILHETEAVYDVEILNNPRKIDTYVTDMDKALNMGVYFADLSFTSMFDYPQEAMKFMGAAQALSEELNINGVFTEDIMMRLEENLSNKDSLMDIVAQTYMETDLYLHDNERPVVAKAVLAGAWIEGLYIAVNLKTSENKEKMVWDKVAEQKPALTNLVNLISDCNEPKLQDFLDQLKEMEELFKEVELDYGEGETRTETDTVTKMTKIISKLEIKITKETIDKISEKATLIRKRIVKQD